MRGLKLFVAVAVTFVTTAGLAQSPVQGPYRVLRTARVGGVGNFDYVYADVASRRLYIPRSGTTPRITVFDLDTLEPAGEIPNVSARGVAVDPKSGHGFASSKPIAMWDTKTLAPIRTIDIQGSPDGIMFDPFNQRVWVFSHSEPNATVINAVDGTIVGTMSLGGAPEQAVSDSKGHIFVNLEDKDSVAVVDAATMKVQATYALAGKGGAPAGLGFDVRNQILFAAGSEPPTMVILKAGDGTVITSVPIGAGVDGAVFSPNTMEAFSSQRDGTLTVVRENSPTDFVVEQTVRTMPGAKTLTLDSKTDHILLIAAETTPPPGGGRGRGQMVPDSFSILVVGR